VIFVALALATGMIGSVSAHRAVPSESTNPTTTSVPSPQSEERFLSPWFPRQQYAWHIDAQPTPAPPKLTILHPNNSHTGKHTLPSVCFVAVIGIQQQYKNIYGLKWELLDKTGNAVTFEMTCLSMSTIKNKKTKEARWRYVFRNVQAGAGGPYKLTATAQMHNGVQGASSHSVQFDIAQPKPVQGGFRLVDLPVFTYPDPSQYDINQPYQLSQDDLTYFAAYGDSTQDIGAPNPPPTIGGLATGIPSWSSVDNFWFAEFDNLGANNSLLTKTKYAVAAYSADGVAATVPYVQMP
jgi:hypothetical protein